MSPAQPRPLCQPCPWLNPQAQRWPRTDHQKEKQVQSWFEHAPASPRSHVCWRGTGETGLWRPRPLWCLFLHVCGNGQDCARVAVGLGRTPSSRAGWHVQSSPLAWARAEHLPPCLVVGGQAPGCWTVQAPRRLLCHLPTVLTVSLKSLLLWAPLLGTPDGRDLGGEAKAFQGQKVVGVLSQAFVLRNRRKHESTRKTGPCGAVGGAPL